MLTEQNKQERLKTMEKQETYTPSQMVSKFGFPPMKIGPWVRWGYIPRDAIVSQGVYKKSAIDELVAVGALPPRKGTGGITGAKKPTVPKIVGGQSEPQVPPSVTNGSASGAEIIRSRFWKERGALAATVLLLPELARNFVIACVDEALSYCENKSS
jgi:hypothetical protein